MRKIPARLRGTNFCTSSARFAPSFVRQPNGPECIQIVQKHKNVSLGFNGVDRVRSLRKIPTRPRGMNFCTSSAHLALSFVRQPNGAKYTHSMKRTIIFSLESNGVDRVRSLRKIPTRHRGTNFCTSSAHFAPSFVSQPNGPQCTKIVRNTPNT